MLGIRRSRTVIKEDRSLALVKINSNPDASQVIGKLMARVVGIRHPFLADYAGFAKRGNSVYLAQEWGEISLAKAVDKSIGGRVPDLELIKK